MITKIDFIGQPVGYMVVDGEQQTVYADDFERLMVDDRPDGSMRQAGYVFTKPKQTINLIRRFDDADLVTIKRLVEEKKGGTFDLGQPCEIPEPDEEEENLDDDEG